MNKTSIVAQLNRLDIDKLRGYRELLDFYHGRQWEGRGKVGGEKTHLQLCQGIHRQGYFIPDVRH